MRPKQVKKLLLSEVKEISRSVDRFCMSPGRDFTRKRKIPVEKLMLSIIGMGSGNLTNELLDCYNAAADTPTASAFIQQRNKLKPEAFEKVFQAFSGKLHSSSRKGMALLAVDGSDIQIATDPRDAASHFSGSRGRKGYNLLHLNALYDLNAHIYVDVLVQKRLDLNEHSALVSMIDRSDIPQALVIADRGYESYNNLAHIQEKGWFYLIRVKDKKTGIISCLDLPDTGSFDIDCELSLTRKQTNKVKDLLKDRRHYRRVPHTMVFDYLPQHSRKKDPTVFYNLRFRVVRFPVADDTYETVLTNLTVRDFPLPEIRKLYSLRWDIETSFRDLKYTIGMLDLHAKKVACALQEIYAHLIMYNFAEAITSQVSIRKKQRAYIYKANFTVAVHMCRLFFWGRTTPPVLETVIANNLIPIRPDRHWEREIRNKGFRGFLYRVA